MPTQPTLVRIASRGPLGSCFEWENGDRVEKIGDLFDPDDPALWKASIVNLITSHQGPRVRKPRLWSGLEATWFQHHDGFVVGESPRCTHELLGVDHFFHVEHDAPSFRVVSKEVDEVAEVDIDHGPEGREDAEAHMGIHGPVENRRTQAPP